MKYMKMSLMMLLVLLLVFSPIQAFSEAKELEPENAHFVDQNLVGTYSSLHRSGPIGESQKRTRLPDLYKRVETIPQGQSNGYVGGSKGSVYFFEYGGGSQTFTVSFTYKGVHSSTQVKYENGKAKGKGSGYGAEVPNKRGNWIFVFIKNYTITPYKHDVYLRGSYQYSYMTYVTGYTTNHRWK